MNKYDITAYEIGAVSAKGMIWVVIEAKSMIEAMQKFYKKRSSIYDIQIVKKVEEHNE